MYCTQCGNENEDSAKFCRKCGARLDGKESDPYEKHNPGINEPSSYTPYSSDYQSEEPQKTNVLCVVGCVFGCASFLINIFGLIGIAGIVLSIAGLAQSYQEDQAGKTPAVIGIITGAIATVLMMLSCSALR